MRIDFARLNHILIPASKEGRDRVRESRLGRVLAPVGAVAGSLTDEGRTLFIVTPLVGAFALDVQRTSAYLLFAALLGILAGALLVGRTMRLSKVAASVHAPRRVTVGEPLMFTVTCTSQSDLPTPPIRVRGPFLPWDGKWLVRAPAEIVLRAHGSDTVSLSLRLLARGVHHLDPFTAAAVAPLGLTVGRRIETDGLRVTVVPRIANVVDVAVPIATRHQPGGLAFASKNGESRDLLGVRPYRPGDAVRDLHAKSWARTGAPVVREYQQEYFTRVGVILDTDTHDPGRLEAIIELAAGVLARLSRGDTLVDVLVVGDRVHELTLGRSLGTFDQALDLLATVEQGPLLRAQDLGRKLDPYLERLSSVVLLAHTRHSGDGEVGALVRAIEGRGPLAKVVALDEAMRRALHAREPITC